MTAIGEDALKQLFTEARTANDFTDQPVSIDLLRQIYDLAKWGATSMNTQPARYVVLTTPVAKERLLPYLSPGNVEKTRRAPLTVIVARDTRFYEHMPTIWHGLNAEQMFADNAAMATATAMRGTTLSGAYFMLAARALGVDCGPMSGFDIGKVNAEFFPDGRYQADFLLNLGYADHSKTFARNPRLTFEQAVTLLA
jgi:3-hydroxypropanoate dehydrogenase